MIESRAPRRLRGRGQSTVPSSLGGGSTVTWCGGRVSAAAPGTRSRWPAASTLEPSAHLNISLSRMAGAWLCGPPSRFGRLPGACHKPAGEGELFVVAEAVAPLEF